MFAVPATPAIFGQFFAGGSPWDGVLYVWIADELWIYAVLAWRCRFLGSLFAIEKYITFFYLD
jgi:hypothetical protein